MELRINVNRTNGVSFYRQEGMSLYLFGVPMQASLVPTEPQVNTWNMSMITDPVYGILCVSCSMSDYSVFRYLFKDLCKATWNFCFLDTKGIYIRGHRPSLIPKFVSEMRGTAQPNNVCIRKRPSANAHLSIVAAQEIDDTPTLLRQVKQLEQLFMEKINCIVNPIALNLLNVAVGEILLYSLFKRLKRGRRPKTRRDHKNTPAMMNQLKHLETLKESNRFTKNHLLTRAGATLKRARFIIELLKTPFSSASTIQQITHWKLQSLARS